MVASPSQIATIKEQGQPADIKSGKGFPRPFVDKILTEIGVEYVDFFIHRTLVTSVVS